MQFPAPKIAAALLKKGFQAEMGDHTYFSFYFNGIKTAVRTKMSHGAKSISGSLIGCMKRQMKLETSEQFKNFINCPLKKEQYEKILEKQGIINIDIQE